jgi:glycosyltransferase 2 family protein
VDVTETPPGDAAPTLLERVGSAGATAVSLGGEGSRVRRVLTIVLVGLTVIFIALFVATQWSRLPSIRWRFEPGWLAVCVLALALFNAVQAQLWLWILRALGGRLGTARGWVIWSVTLLARYVPTNLALVVGRVAMAEREGVSKRVSMASTVYQIGIALTGASAVGAYFVIALPQLQAQPARFAALAIPVLGLIGLHPRIFHPLADYVLRRLGREALPLSLPFATVVVLTLVGGVSFAIAGVGVYAFAQAIHGVAPGDAPTAIGAYSVGFAASVMTVVLPGGLGAREGVMVAALSPIMPLTVAAAVAVAVRLIQVVIEVVFAILTPLWARRSETGSPAR